MKMLEIDCCLAATIIFKQALNGTLMFSSSGGGNYEWHIVEPQSNCNNAFSVNFVHLNEIMFLT